MKTIQWGMVGTGNVTEVKSGPGFYKSENSALNGVTNRTKEKAISWAKRHGVGHVYNDMDEMIADGKVDAIYIATPPASHKEYALKCAAAKIPCYIEKPVALNLTDHMEMLNAFKKSDTLVFAAYYRRAQPRFLKVQQLLNEGLIGDIRFVQMNLYRPVKEDEKINSWRVDPELSGGGLFMDVGVHMIDIVIHLLGNIKEVQTFRRNQTGHYAPEDNIAISLLFENGILGTGNFCFTTKVSKDEIEIIGEKGNLRFACFGTSPIILETSETVQEFDVPKPEHVHQPLIQSIVNELNGMGKTANHLEDTTNTAWVCEQIYQSPLL
ncbi:MAG: Gfo/Idh/MocA family oxidoreductase [Turicibacter sp.]|nr:Gfo/Idh/MocA family oxidoreductase [Turicibacter sp.]